ncbi:MAG: 5-(carboxyamino)imidazole ribonucleotide synthase [Chitinophagaceae bacterium]|nr:5-(carboxyamino)imidazole ribonucleotide synthase [Chitinophagaceae bacterium]
MAKVLKAGILGGGQLGKMLLQQAANYPVETFVLEDDPDCPAAHLCHHFIKGDIQNFDDVYNFGRALDVLTIEIEAVNIEALEKLENEGVKVYPSATALRIIKNKILQKQFYKTSEIPSAEFKVVSNRQDLENYSSFFPAVNKLAEGGYDGKGVQIIRTAADISKGFDAPGVLEKMVEIQKEIAVIVAVDDKKGIVIFPPVEMVFDGHLNLLDYQFSPAEIPEKTLWRIEAIAIKVGKSLNSPGLFAVELFIDTKGDVFVNETAPRVHNSGHHTIEANYSSQYDMLWRILLGYPLGNTASILSSSLVNLIGEEGHTGEVHYEGIEEVLKLENTFIHLYGKKQTKPGRKMGHVTLLGKDRYDLVRNALEVKRLLKVISKPILG